MKTIKFLKDITTLEVGDKVVFGDLEYTVTQGEYLKRYYLALSYSFENGEIFNVLNTNKQDFIDKLGIKTAGGRFPETYSLEALTAVVSALFKEYEKQNKLPKTWEEFCKKNPIQEGEYYIEDDSTILALYNDSGRDVKLDRNVCISKQEAEAFLALKQLRQLRKCYIGDWEPDWTEPSNKYCINPYACKFEINTYGRMSRVLSFPNYDLANQFLTNFKDLIEIAKPLL